MQEGERQAAGILGGGEVQGVADAIDQQAAGDGGDGQVVRLAGQGDEDWVADAAAQRDGIGDDSIAGGAGKPRVAQAKAVSLSDGSRIIFASAMILEELEPI